MRRKLLIAGTAGSLILLAGCAPSADGGADLTAEISYAYWDANQTPAMDALITEFNKKFPEITVKTDITPYTEYFSKLQTQASSGTLPDVFWMMTSYTGPIACGAEVPRGRPAVPADSGPGPKALGLTSYPSRLGPGSEEL